MRPSRSLLPYYGGKAGEIGRQIAEVLETIDHSVYAEWFGGMYSVGLYKKPVLQEIYNDLNGDIVNLFRVLRQPKKARELARLVSLTPYSRQEWSEACRDYQKPNLSDVERARLMFVILGQGALGRLYRKSWGCGSAKYGTSMARSFQKKLERFEYITERFLNILVENQPFEKLAVRWDKDNVLQYWDPPYTPDERAGGGDYLFELNTLDQHRDLVALALGMTKAKIAISGYPNATYLKLEYAGWQRLDFKYVAESAKKSGTDIARTESLWLLPSCQYVPPVAQTVKVKITQAQLVF